MCMGGREGGMDMCVYEEKGVCMGREGGREKGVCLGLVVVIDVSLPHTAHRVL